MNYDIEKREEEFYTQLKQDVELKGNNQFDNEESKNKVFKWNYIKWCFAIFFGFILFICIFLLPFMGHSL